MEYTVVERFVVGEEFKSLLRSTGFGGQSIETESAATACMRKFDIKRLKLNLVSI